MNDDKQIMLMALLNDEYSTESRKIKNRLELQSEDEAYNILLESYKWFKEPATRPLVGKIERSIAEYIMKNNNNINLYDKIIKQYQKSGIKIINFWNKDYPLELKKILNPPLILYVKGQIFPGRSRVAIVGTRNLSFTGRNLAFQYSKALAEKGHTIVSGLARGVDTIAHEGTLSANGTTIAVLGNPINEIYPKENLALADKILTTGSIVSEMSQLAVMHRGRFVDRNRIISGISEAVLIIESTTDGGTIHQARFALEQGRKVYVIKHEHDKKEAQDGYVKLLSMGAIPVTSPEEIDVSKKIKKEVKIEEYNQEQY